ncbi:Hsp20/alpha crystallin family protein [Corallincola luteus]|uniref:Hsp20/alpha crystallin family protein n=1 Tax=Corallincola luteus TaxID=1775177 RepID=A0ABY2AN69_9GAMM|nr:Hsp20/alpha crystallin family protein [Corallincola luteus]TCI04650.1 Hsp20/alpha crystallin family protein [Corallincola luteus]
MKPLFPSLFGDKSMPVDTLQQRINSLFDEFSGTGLTWAQHGMADWNAPAVDVVEKDDQIVVTAELPDIKEQDIQLQFDGDQLILKGEKQLARDEEEDPRGYHLQERFYGHFERRIPLHAAINREGICAEYRKGVLKVVLPKSAEARDQHQDIGIKFAD